ncbi:MAG: DNA replication and repair protein recF [uncultured bacterium]|nr:MAG: DNA replication and repair protein recF [uncultured bacterium]
MHLAKLKLTNFRNHKTFTAEFIGDITVIVGPNAAGKTNILEAIHYLATTKSFKAKYDRDIIKHTQDFARIEGRATIEEDDTKDLELYIAKNPNFDNASIKKAKINKVPKALQKFAGTFNSVLFSPEDVEILTGSPQARRKFLDMLLFQISTPYKKKHAEYVLAVKNRNKILEKIREFGRGWDELGFWNTKVVQNGLFIQEERDKLFEYLKISINKYGKELNDEKTNITINYLKSPISFDRLAQYKDREVASASTLVGPHRDDFEVSLNDFDIAEFGSRGQQRAAILALKFSELDYFVATAKTRPVLLLDDVFSELDDKHEQALQEIIGLQQTIITTTEKAKIKDQHFQIIEI